jgi:hypothetical protein
VFPANTTRIRRKRPPLLLPGELIPAYILSVSVSAIHGLWIPAIPAGMTCFEILVYNDERGAWERKNRRF